MAKKIKDTDYLFISTNIRCQEKNFLTSARKERMLSAPSVEEAAQVLYELGYAPFDRDKSLDDSIALEREKLFETISPFVPKEEILDVFKLKYDYHNLKVMVKNQGVDCKNMMVDAGRFPVSDLLKKYTEKGDFKFLPEDLCEVVTASQKVLLETGDPQRSDFVLDKAYFAEMLALAKKSKCDFLVKYVQALIDSANLSSTVRALRMHKDQKFLQQVLFDGGTVDADTILSRCGNGVSSLFRSGLFRTAAELGDAAIEGGSLTAFEKEADNAVLNLVSDTKKIPFGVEVVIGYIAAKEAEFVTVRIIMSGLMAGISPDSIRERLRVSYV